MCERNEEIKGSIGAENYTMLIDEIMNGNLTEQKVKSIGLLMHPQVHGVFVAKHLKLDLADVMCSMMDKWWTVKLFSEEVNGEAELFKILSNAELGLQYLADRMRPDAREPDSSPIDVQFKKEPKQLKDEKSVLGKECYAKLLDSAKNGDIDDHLMLLLATGLHPSVKGEYIKKSSVKNIDAEHVMRAILAKWYTVFLHTLKAGEGREPLIINNSVSAIVCCTIV